MHIDFSTPDGVDIQCAFNHTGVLCGSCQQNLSVSLGSSRCIECPYLWPAISVAILVTALLAGLVMVTLTLLLNLTVATRSLNSIIFYANVLAANHQLCTPFKQSNFFSVFISWLNLDIGIDVCSFKGLNAYSKAWLQPMFPPYIILIVVVVIYNGQSLLGEKFAILIGQKNPVATLAALILLSYAKILQSIIEMLSVVSLLQLLGTLHHATSTE